jgi:D-galacturonate reductase
VRATVIGGGMIVQDQILPSLDFLRRTGAVEDGIGICARRPETLAALSQALPAMPFVSRLEPYHQVLAQAPPRSLAVIALPDPLHFDAVMTALRANLHVLCVKPLVLTVRESEEIEREANARNLLVAIEYHKRFDDRALMARQKFRAGAFGEFRLGTAILFEKWFYRRSNFQNWFTADATDAFTYIGCHYVDLVAFITGLTPSAISVYAIRDRFPNGVEGYLWTDARVVWSNGGCLNVQNALGYPDHGPGGNVQGLTMWCDQSFLRHSDQYRGVEHCTLSGYSEPSPDYMQMVEWSGGGQRPVGYGYRSIEAVVEAATAIETGLQTIEEIDRAGLIATPANSRYNERVIEAGRKSLLAGGTLVPCAG